MTLRKFVSRMIKFKVPFKHQTCSYIEIMKFNEDSRVKIPTVLHLIQLGYQYLSLSDTHWDKNTNIFPELFHSNIQRINPQLAPSESERLLKELSLTLENEDLGRAFYEKITDRSGIRLIDFDHFENNAFHVVTELPCIKDEEEFRPDITLLINGLPLAFIEVKKPNNLDGIQAEHERMKRRNQNKKFRNFLNATQVMVFSNDMDYDDSEVIPLQGAFYCSSSYRKPIFNYFREENESIFGQPKPLDESEERMVLKDNNLVSIKNQSAYVTNRDSLTPTKRICSSLFTKDRLAFLLQYALAYVESDSGLQKHIMRYPQIFATKAIANKLDEGIKKGIVWHTQGSGKTALTYYNVKHLTDYFQKKNIVPKFYFIVDRIDLLKQASKEFRNRGLLVNNIDSRVEFTKDIKSLAAVHNDSGKPEITVVNIHKFQDDPNVTRNSDYNINIQRVYFMDEVHRSYNPKGSFLHNLRESDPNSIKIGLTGTPLLGTDFNSRSLFGDYIHKYYYNSSIQDGYTLRLIREEIETEYKMRLKEIIEGAEILEGHGNKRKVYAHDSFVEPMLDYIVNDFEKSREAQNDSSIGAMVVCDSSDQAKKMHEIFQAKYSTAAREEKEIPMLMAAEPRLEYGSKKQKKRAATSSVVVLHDVGSKSEQESWIKEFKAGEHDILFVFNMLLTGFDAPRLKKLYVGRMIKAHNLLQTLTRVNRTYKDFRYGYVVDFAGIEDQFKKTSQDYFNELQNELGDELESYSDLFLTEQEITEQIGDIKEALFHFETANAEVFDQQISQINDRKEMLAVTGALNKAKNLYNLIRLSGNYELLDKLDFRTLNTLSRLAQARLQMINTKEALSDDGTASNLLNNALENVIFSFHKIKEEEMKLADELRELMRKTREAVTGNFDPKDPILISLKEELERLFKKMNLSEHPTDDADKHIKQLENMFARAKELDRKNRLLSAKYKSDTKYARLHKRLLEKDPLTDKESKMFEALSALKALIDDNIEQNIQLMDNEAYLEKMMMRLVLQQLKNESGFEVDAHKIKSINRLLVNEYLNEYKGASA